MREIIAKYSGECRKCNQTIEQGARAVYEKHVGIFCPDCAPPMTVSECAALYLAAHPGKAYPSRANHIRRFTAAHGEARMEDFPRLKALAWRDELRASLKANTVRTALAYASHLFNWAIEYEICADNPFRKVRPPKAEPRGRYLTPDEYKRLKAASPAPARHAFILAIRCGLRKGELLGLRRENVLLEIGKRGALYLPHTKNGKPRLVPLADTEARAAVDALLFLPGESSGPLVPLSSWQFHHAWYAAREAAGIPDVWVHDLRRTTGTVWAQNGASLAAIQELLGHSDPGVTRRTYAHMNMEAVERAMAEIDAREHRVTA